MKKDVPFLRIAIGIAVLAAAIVVVRLLPVSQWLTQLQTYVRGAGALGYVVYTIVYAIVGLFFPAVVLTVGAGAIFGVIGGTLVALAGATLTATTAFLLARTVLRSRVERFVASRPKFAAVDRAVARDGARIVLLVRLAAVFPFLFVNYAFGLTGIKTGPYVLATVLGILPAGVVFVYLGAAGAALATQTAAAKAVLIAGAVIAVIVSIFISRLAARAIREAGADPLQEPVIPPPS